MEYGIRLQIFTDLLCIPQFPVRQKINQLMHLIWIFIKRHQTVLNLKQMMTHLEDTGSQDRRNIFFLAVDLICHSDIGRPVFLRIIQIRLLNIVPPVLNIFNDDLIRRVNRKASGKSLRPGPCDSPGPNHILLPVSDHRIFCEKRSSHDNIQIFILIYIAVRLASADRFQKILSFGKHKIPLLPNLRCQFFCLFSSGSRIRRISVRTNGIRKFLRDWSTTDHHLDF